ncbi:hypothetical protein LF1_52700 [Rubripirellula obstinata]|uniref:Uncharacterized protein n=1 Tax=Rubripirellula obstinata TaxID=406547 RepID=A0A5B1CB39_9BACT|nr:hypothetical protein [Rubripirellula obstinata]KAA1257421.1 hypothetical protein LF1_52700 [Rubripirellula obstinata]
MLADGVKPSWHQRLLMPVLGVIAGFVSWTAMLLSTTSTDISPPTIPGAANVTAARMVYVEMLFVWAAYLFAIISVAFLAASAITGSNNLMPAKIWFALCLFLASISILPSAIALVRGFPVF